MKTRHRNIEVPPSRVTVVEINDPTTADDDIEVIKQNVVQLRSEPLRARRVVVRLENTVLIYHSTNLAVRTRTMFRPGFTGFVAFGPQAAGSVNGFSIRPHLMLMAAAGAEGRFVVDSGYESIAIGISPAELKAHLRAREQRHLLRPRRSLDMLVCDAAKMRSLFSLGKRLADTAAQVPDLFDGNIALRTVPEMELVETLLEAIGSSEAYAVTRSDETHQAHSQIVRLAEELVLKQGDGPLYVTDLCKAAAASERSLEYAFKEILGMSPIAFLKRLRLHRVRQALKAADRGTTTVSAEALKWGFWHFGDFSKAYKDCFGESPSQTLRREPRPIELVRK